ncbi:Outer membrane protein (porin) [Variovorax sp. YR750]|nr:Outer membrane protein (porin) [Variovorax sp. YR750]
MVGFALLGAIGAAHAQSSVSVYGAVDLALTRAQGNLSSTTQLKSGENYTSRIGFTGKEDLGGGLYAGFDLESELQADTGLGGSGNTNNQASGATTANALAFNRFSVVKLGGPFGELRLGRDYTSHYRNRVEVDPFQNQGITSSQAQAGSIAGVTGVRASNMINYVTPPTLGGFFGVVNYYLGENASNTANSKDGKGQSVRLGYRQGPWLAAVSIGKTAYATTATNGDTTSANAALSYNFGFMRLMGGYYRDKVARTIPLTGKGYIVGVTAPVFGLHEVRAAYSRYGTDAAGDPVSSKIALGYVHNLSKRTALYANVARVTNSGGATAAIPGATSSANGSSHGYEVGLRHLF